GMQCQVDGGELRKVLINGVEKVVYFMVFVLSCSRLMYVSASLKPIDTSMFIRMHDAAFRFFGGMPQECVYDQTKLVVIHEQYRELELNERFAQFATSAGFRIRCCRGYDPESKGKVEAGVKYVKGNCLYGEVFSDFSSLQQTMDSWLREVANVRRHGTTGRQPVEHYEQVERQHMRTYLAPSLPETAPALVRRKVDKTGLISWQGNRYSVPMQLQRGEVYLREDEGQLLIHDISGERVATWPVHKGKGEILKNTNHYRDPGEQIQQLEQEITALLGETSAKLICQKIQLSEPKIYKDQLRGLRIELSRLGRIEDAILTRLMSWEKFSVKQLVEAVEAWRAAPDRLEQREAVVTNRSKALQHYKGVSRHDIH
ncbi:MAG: IS21 family transposase, partial [Mariprofundus sp.]